MNEDSFQQIVNVPDDGFAVTTAEPWVKSKVTLISQYLNAFVTSIATKVDEVIFVDLYARNGLYCLGAKKEIFAGIPIMALQQDLPISKYVFCEGDAEQARILKIRTKKYFKDKNIVLLQGKPEDIIDKIKMYVPESRKSHRVATLCVGDAFGLEPSFDTVRKLSEHNFTFLLPITFHLGNKINYRFYLTKEREKLSEFLGLDSVQADWKPESNDVFYKQIMQQWESRALELGMNSSVSTHKLDSGLMEMPTYGICLMAKKYSAKAIQVDALAGSHIQFALFNQN